MNLTNLRLKPTKKKKKEINVNDKTFLTIYGLSISLFIQFEYFILFDISSHDPQYIHNGIYKEQELYIFGNIYKGEN